MIIAILIYPLLALLENESWYGKLFVQKSPGEVKRSLLMLFLIFAAAIAVAWGVFGKPFAAAVAILIWGVGDAAAALVGIPFGKHRVVIRPINGKKSWEGSAAMLAVSLAAGFGLLWRVGGYSAGIAALSSLLGVIAGTASELFSPGEWDTVTVPITILAMLLLIL